jgi:ribose transport system substrate-binding protein
MANVFHIGVIPPGSTYQFWKWIQASVTHAEHDLQGRGITVDIQWKAPLREDNSEEQDEIFEGFIRLGVDGVVLTPFDAHTLVVPVEEAARAGIPTVVVDSEVNTMKIVSFISTDNK